MYCLPHCQMGAGTDGALSAHRKEITMSQIETSAEQSSRKYLVAAGLMLLALGVLGLGNGTLNVYIPTIADALDVPRSTLTIYDSFANITAILACLFFSKIYRAVGARGVVLMATIGYAGQFVCSAIAANVYVVWFGGIFQGVGNGFASRMILFAVTPYWFEKRPGTVIGIVGAMTGVTGMFATTVVRALRDSVGYQSGMLIEAGVMMAVGIVATLMVKTSPTDPIAGKLAKLRGNDDAEKPKNEIGSAKYYKNVFSSPVIIMLIVVGFLLGGIINGFSRGVNSIGAARNMAEAAAFAYSLHFGMLLLSKIATGALRDRIKLPVIIVTLSVFFAASMVLINYGDAKVMMMGGLFYGIGATLGQLATGFIAMDVLGKYYDSGVVGVVTSGLYLGQAILIPVFHISYDVYGTYNVSITIWLAMIALMLVLYFTARKMGRSLIALGTSQGAATIADIDFRKK